MKRKLLAFIIILAILAGTYGLLSFILNMGDTYKPKAVAGVLDLSHWNFAEQGIVLLDGEWEFYPDKLLHELDMDNRIDAISPNLIKVPGSWSEEMGSVLGKATYRLFINIHDGEQIYGLKTLSIQMSARIIVNGKVVGSSGIPAEGEGYVAKNKPIVTYFPLHEGRNDIIVEVANYAFPASSGIKHSIYLGLHEQITTLQSKALAYDWISVSVFLIMGLYFVGLYTQRRQDSFYLIFGLLCMFITLYSSTRGERVIYDLFNDLPVEAFLRIQIVSTLGASTAMFLFIYSAFRPYSSKVLVRSALVIGTILILLSLGFVSLAYNQVILPIHSIYVSLSPVYLMYVLVLAALDKIEGSFYLAIAMLAINVYAIVQNANTYFAVPIFSFPPVEPFLFLLMLSLLISLRFTNAYKRNEQLSVQLIHADKLKDEFITKTAHEFKTPLHGIVHISTSLISEQEELLPSKHKEDVELISTIALHLSQLVHDILDLSRIKQGELKIERTPIDVHSVVDVTLKVSAFLLKGKNIQLSNHIPQELPPVLADENRLRQIVSNLIDNAIKYTEQGFIDVFAYEQAGMIHIVVKDTGVGIHEQYLEEIFEPYKMLQEDSEHSFGLGLPIVKQLVELQNGHISIDSTEGEGTTITFSLPVAEAESYPREQGVKTDLYLYHARKEVPPEYTFKTPYVSKHKGKHTIMVVDDQHTNLKVLIDLLESLDYSVVAVSNGKDALQHLEGIHHLDLVILDLMMPGLSGFDVCREIRKNYNLLEMPILMVTASIHPHDKMASFDLGVNDYLSKPFDAHELKVRVRSLLIIKELVGKAVDIEVAFLQSQIKPHFLYNVLNTIMSLSYTDVEASRKLTTDLADYLRGSFQFSNLQKRVSFKQELNLIHSYIEIERVRFKDRIRIEYNIDDTMFHVNIPPLLIQPLVENAIRHGIGKKLAGGTVKLIAYSAEGYYCIEVEDDGVGMTREQIKDLDDESKESKGVGLKNISRRLKYEYGSGLDIKSEPGVGTTITVRFPCE